jgi:hypothetical protein
MAALRAERLSRETGGERVMFFFFSNGLGVVGSIIVSSVVTVV